MKWAGHVLYMRELKSEGNKLLQGTGNRWESDIKVNNYNSVRGRGLRSCSSRCRSAGPLLSTVMKHRDLQQTGNFLTS
jgi:hypothetical protein